MHDLMQPAKLKVIAIVLARMDSSRLPGKALRTVNHRPLIDYCISRICKIDGLHEVVLATSDREIDNPLADYAENIGIKVFRGHSDNVAKRCVDCANAYGAEYFLRVNGDSPFVDASVIEEGLKLLLVHRPDLVTNLIKRTYPYGVAVELVRVPTLEGLMPLLSQDQAEHVTKVFYDQPNEYDLMPISDSKNNYSKCRMVVDTPEDFSVFESVVNKLGNQTISSDYELVAKTYLALEEKS